MQEMQFWLFSRLPFFCFLESRLLLHFTQFDQLVQFLQHQMVHVMTQKMESTKSMVQVLQLLEVLDPMQFKTSFVWQAPFGTKQQIFFFSFESVKAYRQCGIPVLIASHQCCPCGPQIKKQILVLLDPFRLIIVLLVNRLDSLYNN